MSAKNLLINIGLSGVSLAVFILLIEVGLRVTGLQTVAPNPPQIYTRHNNPSISYALKPNLDQEKAYRARVSTNSLGMRSAEVGAAPTIAVIGDSITFGYGVNDDETLAARLEALRPERQWLNMAVPGYQLEQERTLYEEVMQPLAPSAAMLVFYWNDLDGLEPGKLDDDGILRNASWQPEDDTRPWLERNSAFYKAFRRLLSLRASIENQKEQRQNPQKDPVNMLRLEQYVRDLKAFVPLLPAERYFVIWPDNFYHTETRPMLINAAKDAGFTVIDLYELFGNTVETLGWDTVHPSSDALEKAAQFIAPKLR